MSPGLEGTSYLSKVMGQHGPRWAIYSKAETVKMSMTNMSMRMTINTTKKKLLNEDGTVELCDIASALTPQKLEFIRAQGSYAVVFGKTALAVSVNIRTRLTVKVGWALLANVHDWLLARCLAGGWLLFFFSRGRPAPAGK